MLKNETEVYKAANVALDISSDKIDRLDNLREFTEREDQLFLRRIYNGSYTLYLYKDQKEHFLIGKDNEITELKNKSYLVSNGYAINKNEKYKTQLTDLLKTCSEITFNDINNLVYGHDPIVKLLMKYDNCVGLKTEEKAKGEEKIKFVYGVVIAPDYSQLKIRQDPTSVLNINSAGNFAAGLSFGLNFPRNNRSSSFIFEFLYRHYKFEGNREVIIDADKYDKYSYTFSGNYLRLNAMYRHQWTTAKLKPFINIGFGNGFKLAAIDKSTTESKFYSTITNKNSPIIIYERNHEQAVNLGIGINVKKINIELRAENTNGFSPYRAYKTKINTLYLNLNYIF